MADDLLQGLAGLAGKAGGGLHFFEGIVHADHAFVGAFLDGLDSAAHILGGGHGFFGQFAHFVGHHGKAAPGLARTGGLNGGIEGQQVGLVRNVRDDAHNPADGLGVGVQAGHVLFEFQ